MARWPNTPRPKWALRIPGPPTMRAEANRPPPIRAVATRPRGEVNERPANLRCATWRAATCERPIRAAPNERRPKLAPRKRPTWKERAWPPPRAAKCPPPPRAAKPCPPPPPLPPPPRASASSVRRGTARSNIMAVQAPAVSTGRLAREDRAAPWTASGRPLSVRGPPPPYPAAWSGAALGRAFAHRHQRSASNPDMGAFPRLVSPLLRAHLITMVF